MRRYLEGTGESTETPYFAPARTSPTMELFGDSHPDSDDLFAEEAAYQEMDEVQHHPEKYLPPLESNGDNHLPKPQRDQSA